jgi:hypothetical protein
MQWFWAGNAFLVVAALPGALAVLRARRSIRRMPLAWLTAAALGVTLGGLYNRH